MPLGIVVAGANRPDMKLVEATLESLPLKRPKVTRQHPQHLCLDAGYDYPAVHELVEHWGFTAHIRPRRADAETPPPIPGYRARRWVVERTHSWMNRFRRLLLRWEKKVENYLAMLHFACAWITFRAAGVFG
jgi:putative transposase